MNEPFDVENFKSDESKYIWNIESFVTHLKEQAPCCFRNMDWAPQSKSEVGSSLGLQISVQSLYTRLCNS
jgi:hypothetical protein